MPVIICDLLIRWFHDFFLRIQIFSPPNLLLVISSKHTGCDSHFRNPVVFNILKEPLQVQEQTLHQQKALDLSFNLTP